MRENKYLAKNDSSFPLSLPVLKSGRSLPKFLWIEHERDFAYLHWCEMWNFWMAIFPIYHDFEWKSCLFLRDFIWNCLNYGNWAWTEIHNIELKRNQILWKAINCFPTWIHYSITRVVLFIFIFKESLYQIKFKTTKVLSY